MISQRWRGRCTVVFVTATIAFIAFTSQIFVLWDYLGGAHLHTALALIPFNVFIIFVYINYALAGLTDPGSVPPGWTPHDDTHEVKQSTHALRFCKTCKNLKPPRAHHCRSCGRCNLKMDHHCPWIDNCVGFANYGHFIRFLVYTDISAIYVFTLLCCRLAQIIRDKDIQYPSLTTEIVFLSINLMLCTLAILGVGMLTGMHTYYIATNTTTIEGWERRWTLTIKREGKVHNVRYPYNMGVFKNICIVLGEHPLLWLWPQKMLGAGLVFPMNFKCETAVEEESAHEQQPLSIATKLPIRVDNPTDAPAETPCSMLTFGSTASTLVEKPSKVYRSSKESYEMTLK